MNGGEAEKPEDRAKPTIDDLAKNVKTRLSDPVHMHETDANTKIRLKELALDGRAMIIHCLLILALIVALVAIIVYSSGKFSDKPEHVIAIVAASTGPLIALAQFVRIKTPKSGGQQGGDGP